MRWSDIVGNEWHIPREPREKGNPGTITLPPMVVEIINAQPRIDDSPFVFYGRSKHKIFNAYSQRKRELDARLPPDMPSWVLHNLRRTARKLMTRAKVSTEIAELALGHSIKGIRGVYDDPTEYRSQVDDALLRVSIEIEKILNPDAKVIAFPTR